jgi:preprotein translocase subunit SecE
MVTTEVAHTDGQKGVRAGGTRVAVALHNLVTGYRSIMVEMRRVTWPDRTQIRQMAVGVILLSLFIGGVIAIMDFTFQQILVKWIPQLFTGR